MNETGIHGEVTVVQQHRAGDAVTQQVEGQFVLRMGTLVTGGEEGEPHAPCGLVAQEPHVPAHHRRSGLARRPPDHRIHLEGPVEARPVEHQIGRRFVAVAGVAKDQGEMRRREQGPSRKLEAPRLRKRETRPPLGARSIEIGIAPQLLLDFVVLDVADTEPQRQAVLGLVAREARIGRELVAVVAQERQLDPLLDLPAFAGLDSLEHHAPAHLHDPAVGAGDRQFHVVGRAMWHQRLLRLLRVGVVYPQTQQQENADGGNDDRCLDARTANTIRGQLTMA